MTSEPLADIEKAKKAIRETRYRPNLIHIPLGTLRRLCERNEPDNVRDDIRIFVDGPLPANTRIALGQDFIEVLQ